MVDDVLLDVFPSCQHANLSHVGGGAFPLLRDVLGRFTQTIADELGVTTQSHRRLENAQPSSLSDHDCLRNTEKFHDFFD